MPGQRLSEPRDGGLHDLGAGHARGARPRRAGVEPHDVHELADAPVEGVELAARQARRLRAAAVGLPVLDGARAPRRPASSGRARAARAGWTSSARSCASPRRPGPAPGTARARRRGRAAGRRPPPSARSSAGRARPGRRRAGARRGSAGRCRCRRDPRETPRSCPGGRRARRAPRGTTRSGVAIGGASSPLSRASSSDTCSHWSAWRRRSAATPRSDSRLVSARKPWESCVRAIRSRRSASISRSRSRESAESRPISSPETRNTKRAVTLRGSAIVNVKRGGMKK